MSGDMPTIWQPLLPGVERSPAIAVGFAMHILMLVLSLLLAGLAVGGAGTSRVRGGP